MTRESKTDRSLRLFALVSRLAADLSAHTGREANDVRLRYALEMAEAAASECFKAAHFEAHGTLPITDESTHK